MTEKENNLEEEVVIAELPDRGQDTRQAVPEQFLEEEDPIPQQELFGPGSGVARVEKKVAKGKKPTAADSFRAMMEMKQMMGLMVQDLQKVAMGLQQHEMGLQHLFANFNCLLNLCGKKLVWQDTRTEEERKVPMSDPRADMNNLPLFTKEEYEANWEEVVIKPQKEAEEARQKAMLEQAKKESLEAAVANEGRTMPDCKYCGEDDCEYCNQIAEEAAPACAGECPNTCCSDDDEVPCCDTTKDTDNPEE